MTNQYIITEEELQTIFGTDDFPAIERDIRSRPYNPQYQCGDNCNGECSGEVTGEIYCPEEIRKAEREKFNKLLDIVKRSQILVDTREDLSYLNQLRQEGKVENNDLPFDLTYKLEDFTPRKTVNDINKEKWQEGKVEK